MHCFTLAMNENSRAQATSLYLGEYDVLHTIESFKLQELLLQRRYWWIFSNFTVHNSRIIHLLSSTGSCN